MWGSNEGVIEVPWGVYMEALWGGYEKTIAFDEAFTVTKSDYDQMIFKGFHSNTHAYNLAEKNSYLTIFC